MELSLILIIRNYRNVEFYKVLFPSQVLASEHGNIPYFHSMMHRFGDLLEMTFSLQDS